LIVISGVLAIVALALLIAGLASTGLTLVYISIAVSLVSAVFLGVGAYQRRGEEVPTARPVPEPAFAGDEVTRVVSPVSTPAEAEVTFAAAPSSEGGPTVLVVPGRPRYHVDGCRYLVGKESEERLVAEARNEGYTACGICRPDENLPSARPAEPAAVTSDGLSLVDDEAGDTEPAAPVGRSAATRTARKAAKKTAKTAAKTTAKTTTKTTAKKAAKKATKAAPARAAKAPAKTAKAAPAKKTSAAKKSSAAGGATVVVIPDRDKFHQADCRFVKGVRGTARLPRTEARQQGYRACGVCKP
jgi:hypothetical protein